MDFEIIIQECFLDDPLQKLLKRFRYMNKMAARAINRKRFKHLLQGRTHGAGCVWQWFRTAEPLGERRYENWNTHTTTSTAKPVDRF